MSDKTTEVQMWINEQSYERLNELAKEFHNVDSWGNLTNEQFEEIYDYNTNSKIGTYHWFSTLIARVLHSCEYIANNPNHEKVKELAFKAQKTTRFIIKHRDKINSQNSLKSAIEVIENALIKVKNL